MSVAFGVFDHLDRGPGPLHELYESRLKLVEAYDAAGFRGYHVAEHHATPLGMAPSPGIYLAAVAQRTRRLRFGPLVYIVPLYPPLRLIEEICMLDQLSNGRFELGVGRGISPYELAYSNVSFLEAADIHEEALQVILAGLTSKTLTHRGHYFQFRGVPMELEPVQRPHPPLWQGVTSPESAAAAARRGANVVGHGPIGGMRPIADAYLSVTGGTLENNRGFVGCGRHIFVADTDEEARKVAAPAYKAWYDSLVSLWRKFRSIPYHFAESLEIALARDAAIVGSPATVRAEIERHVAESRCNYFVTRFAYGTLTYEQSARSLALFANEVMPKLR
ncbi:MAG TPA: LLM class flavin-dependent oxidoreductase [Terriglobales bacterium]|nr:LLM class flavin-dependent oxidoreductase [Terriglobales bacterium]